ncbi:MAG: TonB-dependent receptor [Myxococcales bacterium]|nr:TonB-dependent receptor [Myxococcales bacterium]
MSDPPSHRPSAPRPLALRLFAAGVMLAPLSVAGAVPVHRGGPPGRGQDRKPEVTAGTAATPRPTPPRIVSDKTRDDASLAPRHRAKTGQGSPDAVPTRTPPQLLSAPEAPWPAEAPLEPAVVEVPCRVTLDETGAVLAVEVLEPRGFGFDEAAVNAVRASIFAPATQDGVPVPATFRYRYVFRRPALPPDDAGPAGRPTGAAPPPGGAAAEGFAAASEMPVPAAETYPEPQITFAGQVRTGEDVPVEAAAVSVAGGPLAEPVVAVTDAEGSFFVTDLPPGTYRVRVSAPLFATFETDEEVVAGEVTQVTYRLERAGQAFETVVRSQRPPREVTRRTIETREIVQMPGSGGDALRAVENMPGVARPIGGAGLVVIRGSTPADTAFHMDGIAVPLLYHFGALRSVIASDLLERIDFYPGNYSVRYAGVTSGVIDVVPRVPTRRAWTGYLDVNLLDAGAFAEGPLAPNASIAAGVRRSYIDAVLPAVLPLFASSSSFGAMNAPVYWDYQLLSDWEPSPADRLRFFVYGSDDSVAVLFDNQSQRDPTFSGEQSAAIGFHRGQVEWVREIGAGLENRLALGVGYNAAEASSGGRFEVQLELLPIQIREELAWQAADAFHLTLGVDTTVLWQRARAALPDILSNPSGRRQTLCGRDRIEVVGSDWTWKPGFYVETELRPADGLRLLPGLRLDLYDDGADAMLDPRLNVRYTPVPGTTLKLGLGSYSAPPEPQQSDPDAGNPDLRPERSWHYGLGLEQRLWDRIELQLDLFYKTVHDVVRSTDALVERDGRRVPLYYDNIGEARAYGAELLVRYEPDDWFWGWIALTLMRSETRRPDEDWTPSSFDQWLNLTILGSFDLGKGWTAGFRFRVAQGFPRTPIAGSIFDADCDAYIGLPGERNSIRLPWFHQLDLRVDKTFDWEVFKLSVYLDVQNVYYQQNVEALRYNYDYTLHTYTTGLPILPMLGLKGQF